MPPQPFAGFLPHIENYLGEAREFEPPDVTGRNRGYGLFFCYPPDGKTISIVSNGLRFQNLTAIIPQEIACTVWAGQRKQAHLLVPLTAELILRRGKGLTLDDIIPGPGSAPLVPDTSIGGVIASTHPYTEGGEFDYVTGSDGLPGLQIMTLIPATTAEIAFAQQHGTEALYGIWEDRETDLLDTTRQSAL